MNKENRLCRFLLCSGLLLLLTGCVRLTIDPSPQELMGFQEDVLVAYDEAARLYDWFDLAPMPVDESDSVREDETTYFRVRDDGIASTEDLRSRLEEVFTPELAEEIFNKGQYRDFDGRLYAVLGGRGTNIYFLDKTVQAERLSEDRWEVTLTFWADFEDSHMVPEPGTDFSTSYPIATAGYSTTTIYYEQTPDGWRFTSFCSSDGLDLEAETVYTFDYAQGFREDCSDWELICYLLHADGGFAEGAFYRLYQRFLDRPGDILSSLALLDTAPYEVSRMNSLIAGPGYEAAYEDEAGRLAFEETVRRYVPVNEAERVVLKKIRSAYDSVLRQQ